MPPVMADVVLVPEGRDGEIDAGPALCARLGPVIFDPPTRVAVLLRSLAGLFAHAVGMRPSLISRLSPSVLRCFGAGDNRGVFAEVQIVFASGTMQGSDCRGRARGHAHVNDTFRGARGL